MREHAKIVCQFDQPCTLIDFGDVPDRHQIVQETQQSCRTLLKNESSQDEAQEQVFTVLNVGFGLGIVDSYIHQLLTLKQLQIPGLKTRHVIIEAHPDVLQMMSSRGWNNDQAFTEDAPDLIVLAGRWEDVIEQIYKQGYLFNVRIPFAKIHQYPMYYLYIYKKVVFIFLVRILFLPK